MTALGKIKAAILSYPGNYPVTVRFLTNGGVTQLANQRLTQSQTFGLGRRCRPGAPNIAESLTARMSCLSAGNLCRPAGTVNTPKGYAVRSRVPRDVEICRFAGIQRKLRFR